MAQTTYDVIVIGTGAGGGMAIRALCEAGLKVCALNGGRRLDPHHDYRNHRMPYDMKYRGFGDPKKRHLSYGYMDNEYVEGVWEHDIAYTTGPGTEWMWPRCNAVGGKTNFWGGPRHGSGILISGQPAWMGMTWIGPSLMPR
jgi:choline dehydrogenase-like flavoprotein